MAASHVIALFGASGRTGLAIIEDALRRGWKVQALLRPHSVAPDELPTLRVLRGDLDSPEGLAPVLANATAAVAVFGPRPPYRDVFRARATESLIKAMRQQGSRRLIVQTGAQVGIDLPNWSWAVRAMSRAFARSRPQVAADAREQERLVRESGLDWTIVKPPRLTTGRPRNTVRIGPDLRIGLMSKIPRADLAVAVLDEVERPRHVGQAVFVVG